MAATTKRRRAVTIDGRRAARWIARGEAAAERTADALDPVKAPNGHSRLGKASRARTRRRVASRIAAASRKANRRRAA